jgi:peptidyl-prolyl cis-trans isomerase A (cyclophilin A)
MLLSLPTPTPALALSRRQFGLAALALAASPAYAIPANFPAQVTLTRVNTGYGPIDIKLTDTDTPITVNNFLAYINARRYDNTFFHRLVKGFVLQGGGYSFPPVTAVPKFGAIQNEFNVRRSNVRATVAMAKTSGNPNSATSEWFINLADNAGNLDNQNGGFTVFGAVTTPSMAIVDTIAALDVVNAGSPFDTLPLASRPAGSNPIARENLVNLSTVRVLATSGAPEPADRVFNYLEAAFPQFVKPASSPSLTAQGYYFRYYATTDSYVGVKEGVLYYLVPSIANEIRSLGAFADWLQTAASNGY